MTDIQLSLLSLQVLLAAFFFSAAIIFDLSWHKIPNKLCLIAIICGLGLNTYYGQYSGLLNAGAGMALAFALLIPAFVTRILGAGDIKLMMGIGALIGPQWLLWSLAYGIVAGSVTSIALIIWQTGFSGIGKTLRRYWDCFYLRHYFKPEPDEAAGQRIPYAPALALGWLWASSLDQGVINIYSQWTQYFGGV